MDMVDQRQNNLTKYTLRARRLSLGLTQAELADRLGVRANTLARWERGELAPRRPEYVFEVLSHLETASDHGSRHTALAGSTLGGMPLPNPPTSFVGRERETGRVLQLLREHRLVAVIGAGGVGKTRLALRVASEFVNDTRRAVIYVSLASVSDPGLVLSTIAQAAGVLESQGKLATVLGYALNREPVLLVVDNFEQVVGAAEGLIELVRAGPHLDVLVTSRSPLRVSEEQLFRLAPLQLPDLDHAGMESEPTEAVRLFVDRAQAVRSELEFSPETLEIASEICRHVDGLPLAIELAAAGLRTLSLGAIRARISASLDLLVDGPRDQPARHHTMRAAIDWSYGLLSADEQRVFRGLAVFAGDFSLEAATAVCAADFESPVRQHESEVLATMRTLVDHALVEVVDSSAEEPRFSLLNIVREYASERLAAQQEEELRTAERHAEYFLSLAEGRGALQHLWEASDSTEVDQLQREHDQMRGALRWALDHRRTATAAKFGRALWPMWNMRGHYAEGRRWLAEILQTCGASVDSDVRYDLLEGAAVLAYRQADLSIVCSLADDMLSIGRDNHKEVQVAWAFTLAGLPRYTLGRLDEARQSFETALEIFKKQGPPLRQALCLHHLALVAYHTEQYEHAQLLARQAAHIARDLGSAYVGAMAVRLVGFAAEGLRDYRTATESLEEACLLARRVGFGFVLLESQEALGRVAAAQGRYEEARTSLLAALRMHRKLSSTWEIARCLDGLATMEVHAGDVRIGLRLAGAAIALRHSLGVTPSPRQRHLTESLVDSAVRRGFDKRDVDALVTDGKGLSAEQAVEIAERRQWPEPEPDHRRRGSPLTQRETDVLRLLAAGNSNREIAAALILSVRTVERHITTLYGKIAARGRADATAYALRHALI